MGKTEILAQEALVQEAQKQTVAQQNQTTLEQVAELTADLAEGAAELAGELADSTCEMTEENAIEIVTEIIEDAAEGGSDFLGDLLDGVDDLPGLAIAGIIAGGIAVVGGAAFLIGKIIKKRR